MKHQVKPEFLKDLQKFCDESMAWCAKESEAATAKVNDILNIIMKNANRVSQLSDDTLQAIESMRSVIDHLGKDGNRHAANSLASALKVTAKQDEEINSFISPLIETLQFQDRIAQNMNNMSLMINTWLKFRESIPESSQKLSKEQKIDFGMLLLNFTNMKEERDLIHNAIPGLPEDHEEEESIIFF